MQMGREISRDVLMRDFERGEVRLRSRSEVHDELVAVAELDQPGAVGLGAAHKWPAGAERDHPHLVGRKRLCVRKVMVASAAHGRHARGCIYVRKMLVCDTSISVLQWMADMQLSDRIGRRMKLHDLHVLM